MFFKAVDAASLKDLSLCFLSSTINLSDSFACLASEPIFPSATAEEKRRSLSFSVSIRSGTADFPSLPKTPMASIAFSRMLMGLDLSLKAE